MGDAPDQGSSWEDFLPLLALGAGFMRPEAMAPVTNLMQIQQLMQQRRHQQAQEQRALAKEQRAQEASATLSRVLGFSGLEGLDPTTVLALSNLLRENAKIEAAAGQKQREETELGFVSGLEAQLPTELPDVLGQRLLAQPPMTAVAREPAKQLREDLTKRRGVYAETQAVGQRFTPPSEPPPPLMLPGSEAFGLAPLKMPGIPELRLPPENVQQAQRFAWERQKLPTAEEAETLFQIPLAQWPGGKKVAHERVKPPYPPSVREIPGPGGQMTIAVTQLDPASGQSKVVTHDLGSIGAPTTITPHTIGESAFHEYLKLGGTSEGLAKANVGDGQELERVRRAVGAAPQEPKRTVDEIALAEFGRSFAQLSLPERQQVRAREQTDKLEIARTQAQARIDVEQNAPLNEKAALWLHPTTGQPALGGMTPQQVIAAGYVPVTQSGLSASAAAKAGLVHIQEYRSLVDGVLTRQSGSAVADFARVQSNRLRLAALRRAGDPTVKRYDALFGAIATLARATGDTANVAVAEREFLKGFVMDDNDTVESATSKLDQAERILRAVITARGLPAPPPAPRPKATGPAIPLR